jgi:tRNA dimethylallyltransferase
MVPGELAPGSPALYAAGVIPLIVIIGPTAGGKSALALRLALALAPTGGAEIVSADAFQVYRGMNIGTAKPDPAELAQIPHHLTDIVDPGQPFSASDWLVRAEDAVARIRDRGVTPIVVGGTHLYVKLLLEGMFRGPAADSAIRAELAEWETPALRDELERVDPDAAARLHPNDRRRTIRALEVFRLTGVPLSRQQVQWDRQDAVRPDALIVGLLWGVDAINARINARVRAMMDRGLLDEVRRLASGGRLTGQAAEALGYKQLLAHLHHGMPLDEAVERIKIETRRFAKNQRTWMKRIRASIPPDQGVWIDAQSEPEALWPGRILVKSSAWRQNANKTRTA